MASVLLCRSLRSSKKLGAALRRKIRRLKVDKICFTLYNGLLCRHPWTTGCGSIKTGYSLEWFRLVGFNLLRTILWFDICSMSAFAVGIDQLRIGTTHRNEGPKLRLDRKIPLKIDPSPSRAGAWRTSKHSIPYTFMTIGRWCHLQNKHCCCHTNFFCSDVSLYHSPEGDMLWKIAYLQTSSSIIFSWANALLFSSPARSPPEQNSR